MYQIILYCRRINRQQAKGENGVENAVDGDASNTYFQPQQVPYTYTIDLQKSQPLSRVDLSFRLTNGSETYNQYTIETSNDNQNWVKQVDETGNNTLVGFLSHKLTGNARYVRLSVNKTIKEKDHQEADWAAGLVEMSVYGPKISSPIDNNTGTDTNSSTSSSTSSSATTPSSTSQSGATSTSQEPSTSQIGKAVYATQKIYMYKNPTFKKSERVASFAKKPRLNRPMFVVTGTAKSSNGVARYKVRNVETNKTGYITANANFVSNVYYASVPASKTVTVIAAKGVNAYKTVGLTGKAKHYKQGTVLKVTGIEKHNLTTRFKLSNGRYITANKKLIIGGKAAQATKVKTKKAIKVYSDANLTHAKKTIKKGKTISVKGYAYSRATSTKNFGTKRYQVSGGYITANSKYVSVVKTTR
ncbi:hypothetical protein YK48G_11780 [Lentilactobacillus fungorum]|uniref:F5/8 type C domain-containing protein n=1 Tax=Lentilactobacillus fungorum TaxID=2201250 RepID=A0ABQ3VYF4_9LACO|nr:DUF5776 domain-containing protein [Lentilactobacillus fungorum]GHP13753.1 hypothetical protein YK48G_11780 [Lentilactobacillus fungorum]